MFSPIIDKWQMEKSNAPVTHHPHLQHPSFSDKRGRQNPKENDTRTRTTGIQGGTEVVTLIALFSLSIISPCPLSPVFAWQYKQGWMITKLGMVPPGKGFGGSGSVPGFLTGNALELKRERERWDWRQLHWMVDSSGSESPWPNVAVASHTRDSFPEKWNTFQIATRQLHYLPLLSYRSSPGSRADSNFRDFIGKKSLSLGDC